MGLGAAGSVKGAVEALRAVVRQRPTVWWGMARGVVRGGGGAGWVAWSALDARGHSVGVVGMLAGCG